MILYKFIDTTEEVMDEAAETYDEASSAAIAAAGVADTYISKLEEIEAATNGSSRSYWARVSPMLFFSASISTSA